MPSVTAAMMRPSSNMKWNKTEELEPRNILCSATQHRRTVNWRRCQRETSFFNLTHNNIQLIVLFLRYLVTFMQVQAVELDLSVKREGEGEGHSHNSGNLFDVERGHERDSSYQREQRAVVDAHPGHSLTIHQIQDVERDEEMLFPRQMGQQRWGVLLLQ